MFRARKIGGRELVPIAVEIARVLRDRGIARSRRSAYVAHRSSPGPAVARPSRSRPSLKVPRWPPVNTPGISCGCSVSRAGRPALAQAARRSSTACSRSASGPSAACPLPARGLRSLAMPPAQPCVLRRCAAYGERCSDGGGAAARQELARDGTDGVGGLARASASLAAQPARRPVMMCFCSPGSWCVSPSHRMPPADCGRGKYRRRSAEGA